LTRGPRQEAAPVAPEKTYTEIRRRTAVGKDGHFAALEQPETLTREVADLS